MNFFAAQERARRNSFWLAALFLPAVAGIAAFAYCALHWAQTGALPSQWAQVNGVLLAQTAAGVLAFVGAGAAFKLLQLAGGGAAVAKSMGGQLLSADSAATAGEKKLLNIVEEMALAAGAPVPEVYVVPGDAINAFAAGTSLQNAVIGVTRGAMQNLGRAQMQGVVAHEFSHIINGDMRLNMRIIGVIHGLLLLHLAGRGLFYAMAYSRGGRSGGDGRAAMAFFALAAFLMLAGFAGAFFGGLIRAAVSRQREYLADAQAVQFTRNPQGIGGALQTIGKRAGILKNEKAEECAHLFFAPGVSLDFFNAFATHPPLHLRLRAIVPQWDGKSAIAPPARPLEEKPAAAGKFDEAGGRPAATMQKLIAGREDSPAAGDEGEGGDGGQNFFGRQTPAAAVAAIGAMPSLRPPPQHCAATRQWRNALQSPQSARAVVYCMLLAGDANARAAQMRLLQSRADFGVYELTEKYANKISPLSQDARLSLLLAALPALRGLSLPQYELFANNMAELICADQQVDLREWRIQAVATHALSACFGKGDAGKGEGGAAAANYALSILARAGNASEAAAAAAFGKAHAGGRYSPDGFDPRRLYNAMRALGRLPPRRKAQFAGIAAAIVAHDGVIEEEERALLRAYFLLLDCPLAPAA